MSTSAQRVLLMVVMLLVCVSHARCESSLVHIGDSDDEPGSTDKGNLVAGKFPELLFLYCFSVYKPLLELRIRLTLV